MWINLFYSSGAGGGGLPIYIRNGSRCDPRQVGDRSRGPDTGNILDRFYTIFLRQPAGGDRDYCTLTRGQKTGLLLQSRGQKKRIFVSMWQHHYWREKRWVLFCIAAEQRPKNRTFVSILQPHYWREKRWVLYCSRARKKIFLSIWAGCTSIVGKSAGYYCRDQKTGLEMGLHHYRWEENWKLLCHTRGQKTGLVKEKKFRNYCSQQKTENRIRNGTATLHY